MPFYRFVPPASLPMLGLVFSFAAAVAPPAALAQRDLREIPPPDPAAEQRAMRLDGSAAVNLYAADPVIRKPIQINFDAAGRLWVASSEVYPQIQPGEKADDKIIVLEDTTGDGVADSHTVFADGLLIPTGVAPDHRGGCYVAASTELLHLEDTTGDGRADRRRIVLSGFGTEDTHHLIHTLRWGPDGWLYFNQSIYIHSHVETPDGTQRLEGGGIWRFHPESGRLEVFCRGFVNAWGHVFDAYGQSFATDGAYFEGINHVFPDAVFVTAPGATRWLKGLNPGSPKHCGLEILSGERLPTGWTGDLVTNDFRGHRVCRFTLRDAESGYTSRQQPEILTSSHIAFRPIDARMGPDGALYVADWYNPIIQHGEVDFRDPRRDREHGRIWRIDLDPEAAPIDRPQIVGAPEGELASLLDHPALWVRQFAREELKQRDTETARGAVAQWAAAASDPEEAEHRALEAMWIDQCHDVVDAERIDQALAAQEGRIRAAAIRVVGLQRDRLPEARQRLEAAVGDPHPRVRLEAVVALGRADDTRAAETALAALDHPLDDNLDFALWNSLRSLREHWLAALAEGDFDWGGDPRRLIFALQAAGSTQAVEPVIAAMERDEASLPEETRPELVTAAAGIADHGQLQRLLRIVLSDLPEPAPLVDSLVQQTAARGLVPHDADRLVTGALADRAEAGSDDALVQSLVRAAGAWQAASAVPELLQRLDASLESDAAAPTRRSLIAAIGQLPGQPSTDRLVQLAADRDAAADDRAAAAEAVAATRPAAAAQQIAALLKESAAERDAAVAALTRLLDRPALAEPLAAAIAEVSLPTDHARIALSAVRGAGGNEAIEAALRRAGELEEAGWVLTPELSEEILQLAQSEGSPEAGEMIYRRSALQCINCHAIGPAGGLVGPNLVSLGSSAQLDYILESLIEPDAKLKEGYTTTRVLTDDGRVTQGILLSADDQTVRLRIADDSVVTIPVEAIEEQTPGPSLMPAGLVDSLTKAELADLVAFMAALGRDEAFTVSTEPIIRTYETLIYTPEANQRLNRTSVDSAASEEEVFQWRPITTRVDGRLVEEELDTFRQHRETPPLSFVRFDVAVPRGATSQLRIEGPEGMQMWINGRPTPIDSEAASRLPAGAHRITLALDRSRSGPSLRVVADPS